MSRRRVVALLWTGVGLVVVAALAIAGWAITRPAGPESTASAYLQALEHSDGRAAAALVEGADRDALASDFEGASARPTGGQVLRVSQHGDTATASVRFRIGGVTRSASLPLRRGGEGWRLTAGALGTVTATSTIGDTVSIGSELVGVGVARSLLPAAYTIRAAPRGILTGTTSATVLPGGAAEVALTAAVSADASTAATTQLEAYEDGCTKRATAVPAHCGLRVPWAADLAALESIAFRIDKRPTLALGADGSTFAATGGTVTATATGTTRDGSKASFTYRADDWALRGSVGFGGGRMTLAVD